MTQSDSLVQTQQGFTLLEMAIVLMIVGLLLGGLLVPLSAQMEQRNNSDTQKSLSEIKDAITGYALANGRLPCPADRTTPTNQTNADGVPAGQEYRIVGLCANVGNNAAWGVLPWVTLGVSETDAWGNRYTYRVTDYFADDIGNPTYGGVCSPSSPPSLASFALCSPGNLKILSAPSVTLADKVPAVIISHGKNTAGAWTTQGAQILPVSSDLDERENSDGALNNNYTSHTPTQTYDDLVVWISTNILLNRMVTAGKLP